MSQAVLIACELSVDGRPEDAAISAQLSEFESGDEGAIYVGVLAERGAVRDGRAEVAVGVSVMVRAVRWRLFEVGEAGSGMKSSPEDSSERMDFDFGFAGRLLLAGFAASVGAKRALPFPLLTLTTSTISSSSFATNGGTGVPFITPTIFLRIVPNPLPNPRPPGLNMLPCIRPLPFFSRRSRHGLQI